jgi:hypothetical protein
MIELAVRPVGKVSVTVTTWVVGNSGFPTVKLYEPLFPAVKLPEWLEETLRPGNWTPR